MSNPLSAFRAAAHALADALLRQDCFLCSARAGASLLCAECHRALPRLQS